MNIRSVILTVIAAILFVTSIQPLLWGRSNSTAQVMEIESGMEERSDTLIGIGGGREHFFTENHGQWAPEIRFAARTDFGRMAITDTGVIYDVRETFVGEMQTEKYPSNGPAAGASVRGHVIKASFAGGESKDVLGIGILPVRSNYFIGGDEENWAVNVPSYQEVLIEGIYDGIDARFYFDGSSVKYDLILEPTADIDDIRILVEGADEIEVDGHEVGYIIGGKAFIGDSDLAVFGSESGRSVEAAFRKLGENVYGFDISKRPADEEIVIDPVVRSAFISGEGMDEVHEILIGPDGSHYIGGVTFSLDLPITPGAYQVEMNTTPGNHGPDLFLTKMNRDLDGIIFSTFIGGLDNEELSGMSLLLDGSVVMTGYTSSANFPNTTGAADNVFNGIYEGFVARLSPEGDELVYSTFIGGDHADWLEASCTDAQGRVYLTGWTFSSDFPQTGAEKNLSSATNLIFATVLESDGSSILRSMVINSSVRQRSYDILLLGEGTILITGYTYNTSYPVTPGCLDIGAQGDPESDADMFLTELDIFDHTIVRSGKIGGSIFDGPDEIEVDENGDIWIVGETTSPDLPLTNDAFQRPTSVSTLEWFLMRVDRNITTLEYSTYISGDKDEWNLNIEVGNDGLVYLSGKTYSSNITLTDDAFDDRFHGTTDIVVMAFTTTNMSLVHSTYLGGRGGDFANSMIYAENGTVAIGGYAIIDFPMGYQHYLNNTPTTPGFLVYYQLPIPPGPPENLSFEVFQEGGDHWINLSWDPPTNPGNGRPIEYEVRGLDRDGQRITIPGSEEITDDFLLFERWGGAPYEDRYYVTASSITGTSEPSEMIKITEDEPPTFGEDLTPESFTEDTTIKFIIHVRDNYRLDEVWVEYWYSNLTKINLSMNYQWEYRYNATIFTKLAWGSIHYRFHAVDIFGNANQTEEKNLDAIDLEAPSVEDLTPSRVEYGQNITFRFRILEGSGIGTVNFTIRCLGKDHHFNLTRENEENWTYEFEPLSNISLVKYSMWVRDLYGWETRVEGQVNITDTTLPVLVEDLSDESIGYYSDYRIAAVFWDLSPIDEILMRYSFPYYDHWNSIKRTGSDEFSAAIKLPWDEMEPELWESEMAITYNFIVTDTSGNTLRTENVTRNITDPVHLGPLTFYHPTFGYTGEEFLFAVEVDDETEFEGVNITLWYQKNAKGTYSLEAIEDEVRIYYISTVLNEDSVDPLYYEIILTIPGLGEVAYGPFNITVYDGTPPMVYPIHNINVRVGDTVKVIVNAYDNIGVTRYEWEGAPVDVAGNVLNWVADEEGIFGIKVTVYDSAGNSKSMSFTITVGRKDSGGDDPLVTDGSGDDKTGVICLGVLLVAGVVIAIVVLGRKQKAKEERLSVSGPKVPASDEKKTQSIIDLDVEELTMEGTEEPSTREEEGVPQVNTLEEPVEIEIGEEKLWEEEVMAKESVQVEGPESPRLAPLPPPLAEPEEE